MKRKKQQIPQHAYACGEVAINIENISGVLTKKEIFERTFNVKHNRATYSSLDWILRSTARNPIGIKKLFNLMTVHMLQEEDFIELPSKCTVQHLKDNGIVFVVRFINE
jgi:hypothetical protein